MEFTWIAAALMAPICMVLWKHELSNSVRSLIHGLLLVFAATLSAGAYVTLKCKLGDQLDIYDKFWAALPILAGAAATGRCVVGRVVALWMRRLGRRRREAT